MFRLFALLALSLGSQGVDARLFIQQSNRQEPAPVPMAGPPPPAAAPAAAPVPPVAPVAPVVPAGSVPATAPAVPEKVPEPAKVEGKELPGTEVLDTPGASEVHITADTPQETIDALGELAKKAEDAPPGPQAGLEFSFDLNIPFAELEARPATTDAIKEVLRSNIVSDFMPAILEHAEDESMEDVDGADGTNMMVLNCCIPFDLLVGFSYCSNYVLNYEKHENVFL